MGLHGIDVNRPFGLNPAPAGSDGQDDDSAEAPETPLDEPRPPRVQDPPPQPEQKGPYVVRAQSW